MTRYRIETSDLDEHLLHLHGLDYFSVLHKLDDWLRHRIKHSDLPDDAIEAHEDTRRYLRELMEDCGLVL